MRIFRNKVFLESWLAGRQGVVGTGENSDETLSWLSQAPGWKGGHMGSTLKKLSIFMHLMLSEIKHISV